MKTTKDILKINVNEHTEEKDGQTYLSWAWAWDYVLREVDENAVYEVVMFDGKPFFFDENLGYLVMTKLTINNIKREMYLPAMNGANKAQKHIQYTYKTKNGDKSVEPATMFDINKTIMRCLVKNIAMFGLGLYIYVGEDVPTLGLGEEKEKFETFKEQVDEIKDVETLREFYKTKKGLGKNYDAYIVERSKSLTEK